MPRYLIAQTASGSSLTSLLFLAALVAIFYFIIVRPQRSRVKAQQRLQTELEVGDRIQTIGGIQGTIISMDDDTVLVEVESGKIRFVRRAISSRLES